MASDVNQCFYNKIIGISQLILLKCLGFIDKLCEIPIIWWCEIS